MKIQRTFETPASDAVALRRAAAYLIKAGYRQQSKPGSGLRFRRGSLFGTLTSFDPTHWSCQVSVSTVTRADSCRVDALADIATDPSEKRFAEELISAEFISLEAAVANKQVAAFDVSDLKRRISFHVYRVVGAFASVIAPAILAVLAFTLAIDHTGATGAWATALGTFIVAIASCLLLWQRLTRRRTI